MVDSAGPGVALRLHFCDGLGMIKRIAFTLGLMLAAVPAGAQGADDGVPYWVSTAKDTANMRVGPGREYRINWTYVRKGVPLKVLRVMGSWRLVEDPEGARGWILSQFLTRARTGIVKRSITALRENKDGSGRILWRVAPGVIGHIGECEASWCVFEVSGRKGYVRAASVWGGEQP